MDLLAIYVQDHLALSLAGARLARRCLRENRGGDLGTFLERMIREVDADRAVLSDVAGALGGGGSALKQALAVAAELAGRLKPNGRILAYSELSRVWELEALVAGTESRRVLWHTLGRTKRGDPRLAPFEFEALEERAREHQEILQRFHLRAARAAFTAARAAAPRTSPAPAR